jgi:hypothetical protein
LSAKRRLRTRKLSVLCLLLLSLWLWLHALSVTLYSTSLSATKFPHPGNKTFNDILAAAAAFTFDPLYCGKGDVFEQREGATQVEQFLSSRGRSKPEDQIIITSFSVQPRLSVCSGHADLKGSNTHNADLNKLSNNRNVDLNDWSKAENADLNDLPHNKAAKTRSSTASLDLLVVVPCAPQAVDRREVIRNSWGSVVRRSWPHSVRQWRVELVFLMVATSSQTVHARDLLEEGEKHGDLLVADMHDSYDNLTLKMVTGFHWLAAHCDMQRVRHVLKADTDTFVHADMLLHVLEHLTDTQPEGAQNAILGDVVCSAPFSGYLCNGRDPRAYLFRTYPPYAAGPSYLLPGRHVPRMAAVSRGLPLLSAEDAFIVGLVAQSLGLPRLHTRGVLGISAVRHVCRPAPCLMLGDGRVETPRRSRS